MIDARVSYISSPKSRIVATQLLQDALAAIRTGVVEDKILRMRNYVEADRDMYDAIKGTLPAHIFSGTFKGGHGLVNLVEYNRLMTLDIDKLSGEEIIRVRQILSEDPFVYAFWLSPSGKGFKGLVCLDYGDVVLNDPAYWHKVAFKQLSQYFVEQYGIELDKHCSDIPRLCFVSHDPNLKVKEGAQMYSVQTIEEVVMAKKTAEKHRMGFHHYTGINYRRNEPGRNATKSRKIVGSIIKYLESNRISITSSYYEWFSVAMAIVSAFNYDVGERYYLRLCRLDGSKHDEIASLSMLRYCYEHSNFDITLGTLIYFAQRKGFKMTQKAVPKWDTDSDDVSSGKRPSTGEISRDLLRFFAQTSHQQEG